MTYQSKLIFDVKTKQYTQVPLAQEEAEQRDQIRQQAEAEHQQQRAEAQARLEELVEVIDQKADAGLMQIAQDKDIALTGDLGDLRQLIIRDLSRQEKLIKALRHLAQQMAIGLEEA